MALGTCLECGKECSSNALACPHCGNPFRKPAPPPAPKTSGCAWLALIFIAIPFLIGLFSVMGRSSDHAEVPRLSDQECKASLQCWGDRQSVYALGPCKEAVEAKAEYQSEWTDELLETKFPRFAWDDRERGTLRYMGEEVKFQNGFGAWKSMTYICTYDPSSRTAEAFVLPR